jgi:predicted lipid-binding transport protein (Tim44 family)
MRELILSACLALVSWSAMASCDDVAAQIDRKLQASGVRSYTLAIVPVSKAGVSAPAATSASAPAAASASAPAATAAAQGKVVGTCDGGAKQIIYTRH